MSGPKAVFDTNVYLTYLLSPNPVGTTIERLLQSAAGGELELLLPIDIIVELNSVVQVNPRIARRLSQLEVERFLRFLAECSTVLPLLDMDPPPLPRSINSCASV